MDVCLVFNPEHYKIRILSSALPVPFHGTHFEDVAHPLFGCHPFGQIEQCQFCRILFFQILRLYNLSSAVNEIIDDISKSGWV